MANQPQPGGRHARAGAGGVQYHVAGAALGDPPVGRLHKLAARRVDAAGPVVGAELRRVAHVQHMQRARRVGLEHGKLRGVDRPHAGGFGEACRRSSQCQLEGISACREKNVRSGRARLQAGCFLPSHGAVAQCHHAVGDAGAAQALGAHDAAGLAGAVDHHQRLRVGRKVADAVDQLAAGHADPFRDRHAGELLQRAAVEHDHVAAGVDPGFQFRRVDAFGAVVVLDPLAECLRRHVDAAEQHVAGCLPRLGAAVEDGDVGAAVRFQPGAQALGQAAPVIGADDPRGAARQQGAGAELGLRQRAGDRPEQVRGAEFTFLAEKSSSASSAPSADPSSRRVKRRLMQFHAPTLGVCGRALGNAAGRAHIGVTGGV